MKFKLRLKNGAKYAKVKKMQLGRHCITREWAIYELSEKEVSELKGDGPQFWMDAMQAVTKKKEAKK